MDFTKKVCTHVYSKTRKRSKVVKNVKEKKKNFCKAIFTVFTGIPWKLYVNEQSFTKCEPCGLWSLLLQNSLKQWAMLLIASKTSMFNGDNNHVTPLQ